eukprot:gene14153-biopygen14195
MTGLQSGFHADCPVTISTIEHPTDQTSAFIALYPSAVSLTSTSGAIQWGVPVKVVAFRCFRLRPVRHAEPKSATFAHPVSKQMSTFAHLMSRWAIPFLCKYSSPSTTCRVYTFATSRGSFFPGSFRRRSERAPPETYSRKMYSFVWRVSEWSSKCDPRYCTMLRCWSDFMTPISLWTSIAVAAALSEAVMHLIAHHRPSGSMPADTVPNVPDPMLQSESTDAWSTGSLRHAVQTRFAFIPDGFGQHESQKINPQIRQWWRRFRRVKLCKQ